MKDIDELYRNLSRSLELSRKSAVAVSAARIISAISAGCATISALAGYETGWNPYYLAATTLAALSCGTWYASNALLQRKSEIDRQAAQDYAAAFPPPLPIIRTTWTSSSGVREPPRIDRIF